MPLLRVYGNRQRYAGATLLIAPQSMVNLPPVGLSCTFGMIMAPIIRRLTAMTQLIVRNIALKPNKSMIKPPTKGPTANPEIQLRL